MERFRFGERLEFVFANKTHLQISHLNQFSGAQFSGKTQKLLHIECICCCLRPVASHGLRAATMERRLRTSHGLRLATMERFRFDERFEYVF